MLRNALSTSLTTQNGGTHSLSQTDYGATTDIVGISIYILYKETNKKLMDLSKR